MKVLSGLGFRVSQCSCICVCIRSRASPSIINFSLVTYDPLITYIEAAIVRLRLSCHLLRSMVCHRAIAQDASCSVEILTFRLVSL